MIKKLTCIVGLMLTIGCTSPLSKREGGALIGGAGGAGLGALLGGGTGAVVGGAAGALGGGLIGDQLQEQDRRIDRLQHCRQTGRC